MENETASSDMRERLGALLGWAGWSALWALPWVPGQRWAFAAAGVALMIGGLLCHPSEPADPVPPLPRRPRPLARIAEAERRALARHRESQHALRQETQDPR